MDSLPSAELVSMCNASDVWAPRNRSPHPPGTQFVPLWDTGATHTFVTQTVVDACNLAQSGFVIINHPQGSEPRVPVYYVDVILPNGLIIGKAKATRTKILGADVLIGMDIIALGDLAITKRSGKTTFSFQYPSKRRIGFRAEAN